MGLVPLKKNLKSIVDDKKLVDKMKHQKKASKPKTNNILDIIEEIKRDIEENLGEHRNDFECIQDIDRLHEYIDEANRYGILAIDTETMGLDPLKCDIVGLSMYFRGTKPVYVPINHKDYINGELREDQLTREQVAEELKRLTTKNIFHNAPFDLRIIKRWLGVNLSCWWETQVGATLLNENEVHKLKPLHEKYISHKEEKSFADYLKGRVTWDLIPIEYAYLYASNDAVDTFDLYEFQAKFLLNEDRPDMVKLNWLYRNIEIPMIDVVVDLEEKGVAVNLDYVNELSAKYHKQLDAALANCYAEIKKYQDLIDEWRLTHHKGLDNPINIGSPKQLAVLFYDVLKLEHGLKDKGKRAMDDDILNFFADKHPICKAIAKYRNANKLIGTYIDNIPENVFTDGRIHTHFNSNGAKTGRMSSSDPINLQNIPSHNEDIRKMYVGQITFRDVEMRSDGGYIFKRCEEVELADGTWTWVELLKEGDELINGETVRTTRIKDFKVLVALENNPSTPIQGRIRRIIQGADYSGQEPRVLTQLCEDEGMLAAYIAGKDLYSEIASISFDRPYKLCLEHFPKGCPIKQHENGKWYYALLKTGEDDGRAKFEDLDYSNVNPEDYDYDKLADGETDVFKEGKEYRGQAKKILLGIMYGRGAKSIAEQLFGTPVKEDGKTVDTEKEKQNIEKAQKIKDKVYTAFPKIKPFEEASHQMVRERGFVTTLWGRKRRLPNYNLHPYEFYNVKKVKVDKQHPNKAPKDHSPFGIERIDDNVLDAEYFVKKLSKGNYKQKQAFIEKLLVDENIEIVDNNSRIAAAGREIVNSRVQGSAADMSKLALIKIYNDEELHKRDAYSIIPVHDEILIETPLRYARYVKKRFANDMETAAKPTLTIPISCDVVSSDRWYGEELDVESELQELPVV